MKKIIILELTYFYIPIIRIECSVSSLSSCVSPTPTFFLKWNLNSQLLPCRSPLGRGLGISDLSQTRLLSPPPSIPISLSGTQPFRMKTWDASELLILSSSRSSPSPNPNRSSRSHFCSSCFIITPLTKALSSLDSSYRTSDLACPLATPLPWLLFKPRKKRKILVPF